MGQMIFQEKMIEIMSLETTVTKTDKVLEIFSREGIILLSAGKMHDFREWFLSSSSMIQC